MEAFHITQWDTLYETSASRKVVTLSYYSKPNKLVGEGIGLTLAEPDNVQLLGTWALIEALASTAPFRFRGWLVRNGSALDAARMAALTRVDARHFERALTWFSQPEIGWLQQTKLPSDFPTKTPLAKTTSGLPEESPTKTPPAGNGGGLPGGFRQEEGMRKRGGKEEEVSENGPHTGAALAIPSLPDVRTWAAGAGIDPEFACLKIEQARERGDFEKKPWRDGWQSKVERFWKEDGSDWKRKKNGAAPAARPDAWKEGDQEFWWNDSVADVRAALRGAVQGDDKKTAARLREIVATREGQK